jgi:hypothetical protein
MATTEDKIDQQRRVILATKTDVDELLNILGRLSDRADTYVRLGLGDAEIREPDAFNGTGTGADEYVAAMTSVGAIQSLLASGHGTNLEKFAR